MTCLYWILKSYFLVLQCFQLLQWIGLIVIFFGIQFVQEKILNKEKTPPSCCKYYSKKCWRHYLEGAKMSLFPDASSAEYPNTTILELKWSEAAPLPEDVEI